jgi:hypothetical protein
MNKFKVLKQNIMRVHNLIQGIINTGNFIDSCFRWTDPIRSIVAFLVKQKFNLTEKLKCFFLFLFFKYKQKAFILIVLSFEVYMLPMTLLMIFLKNYFMLKMKEMNASVEDDVNFLFFI